MVLKDIYLIDNQKIIFKNCSKKPLLKTITKHCISFEFHGNEVSIHILVILTNLHIIINEK